MRTAPSEVSSDIGTEQEAIHLVNAWAKAATTSSGSAKGT